ncbi:MAG: hypothetical protein U0271_27275 [Polyangiaceae bacterium]
MIFDRARLSLVALAAVSTLALASPAAAQTPPGVAPPPQNGDPWKGLAAGTLRPPPPISNPGDDPPANTPTESSSAVEDSLIDARDADVGRGLDWFWFEVRGGLAHVGLQSFRADAGGSSSIVSNVIPTESTGGAASFGIGAQIIFVTIGLRGALDFCADWQVGTIGAEVGVRFPFGFADIRLDLGAGYAALADFNDAVPDSISMTGSYVRMGVGVDFFPASFLSLGVHTGLGFLLLGRDALSATDVAALGATLSPAEVAALETAGSSDGAEFHLTALVGLHF